MLSPNTIYFGVAPRFDVVVDIKPGKFVFTTVTVRDNLIDYLDNTVWGISFLTGIKNIIFNGINFRIEAKYEMDISDSLSKYPAKYKSNVLMLLLGVSL